MAPTRWGIAGCGLISNDFATAIASVEDKTAHKIVAVAARSEDKAKQFAAAQLLTDTKAYGGYEGLANDKDVEVVYVGAINPAHLAICKLMLNSGKHVLCEKVTLFG